MPDSDETSLSAVCSLSVVIILLIPVMFTTPFSPNNTIAHFHVTDGEVNGTLHLGAFGYCLYMPDKACSHPMIPYEIPSGIRLLVQAGSYTHNSLRVPPIATIVLSTVNFGMSVATSVTFSSLLLPDKSDRYLYTSLCTFVGAALAFSAVVCEAVILTPMGVFSSAGPGFYLTIYIAAALILLFIDFWKLKRITDRSRINSPVPVINPPAPVINPPVPAIYPPRLDNDIVQRPPRRKD